MMERLVKGLHDLSASISPDPIALVERVETGKSDGVLLVTCSELGLYPLSAALPGAPEIATIQTMGGMLSLEAVPSSDLASIRLLLKGCTLADIIVCGHSPCSAMNLLVYPEEWLAGDLSSCAYTDAWLRSHREFQRTLQNSYPGARKGALMDIAVQEYVLYQLEKLGAIPDLRPLILQRRLRLHGWLINGAGLHVYNLARQEFIRCQSMLGADHIRLRNRTARARNARA